MSIALDPRRFGPINDALRRMLELDGADREAAAHAWCHAHPDLADDLRRLLALAEDRREVLAGAAVGALVPTAGVAGEQLGDWTLQAPLGRGGSGEVWLAAGSGAHRDQRAAIKRPLRDDDGGRFERERRRLAQLSDAGIARLIDSGVDADGRPWIAMEYVDGERIDGWCDQRRLSLRARLALLRQVATIVHGAHRALLVHRDLKPANVLVGGDDAPQVKLVDFGIAKDLGVDAAPTIDPMLTPQYASPEQLAGGSITIASDIYQLGLLAHEILSGAVPPPAAERAAGLPPMALAAA
ncbi:MAG: serine/threonine protein kinase, partial [Xanthomonadaceae bacterium]|nr:serine/threonine protein kinase [Xanthomonadaceae bacterium]